MLGREVVVNTYPKNRAEPIDLRNYLGTGLLNYRALPRSINTWAAFNVKNIEANHDLKTCQPGHCYSLAMGQYDGRVCKHIINTRTFASQPRS